MVDPKLLGWFESPLGIAKLHLRDGYVLNGTWQNGKVILIPPSSQGIEIGGFIRPNDAVVNDAGFAAVADWLSLDNPTPRADLCFITPAGSVHRRVRLSLAPAFLVIEPAGKLAFVTTGASESEHAKLMCFDVSTGDRLWAMRAPKPAAEITVVADGECILVGRPHEVPGCNYLVKVTFQGEVVDECPASPYEALYLGEAELEAGRFSVAERWLRVAAEADITVSYRAKAYRGLGELAESDGRAAEALELYRKALKLDARVGVKRKVELLSKPERA